MIKPGYRTSEFWFTLVSFLFSGLYLTGLITENDQKEELITTVSHAVESCILIGGQLIILYKYVNGRTKIKEKFEEKETNNGRDETRNESRSESNTTTTKPRSNKTRSRKTNPKRTKQSTRSKKSSS